LALVSHRAIQADATPERALKIIGDDYHVANWQTSVLVISPSATKNGGILDPTRAFNTFKLDRADVLEMWQTPRQINVAVVSNDSRAKSRKLIAVDYSMAVKQGPKGKYLC
jgi:hypothetical protein